jgi:prepilin-type N-terminal cleavage/methylation domain-containing protein
MKKAFTLIELLVVIAIIAILAALLMPALSRAREEAQKTRCKSSVHNVGIAFQLFTNDHDGVYPGWVDKATSGAGSVGEEAATNAYWLTTWPEAQPYVRSTDGGPYYQLIDQGYAEDIDLWDCPSADNPTWGQWDGPAIVGDGSANNPWPSPDENDHMGRAKKVEFAEYSYDLGRTSRNSVAGRIFYGDSWGRRHQWGASWGYWPYNHADGANAVSVDQAVQWCPVVDGSLMWSDSVPPQPNLGLLHEDPPVMSTDDRPYDRAGWVPNPRMDEDVHRLSTYNRNGVGGGSLTEQQLLYPEDRDDIYSIEGWSGNGTSDPWQHSLVGDPTVGGGGGKSEHYSSSSAKVNGHITWSAAEPTSWWPHTRSIAFWAEPRWHPEIGPFANEGRWDTHDARLLPFGMYMPPNQ